MSTPAADLNMIKLLVIKDWQIYQKQLAAYVAGLLLALSLIGTGQPWPFYLGAMLLLVLLVSTGYFGIGTSLLAERKEQTMPFIMSLPVTPVDFFWGKLLANLTIFLVPFTLVVVGTTFLVLFTPLPDGLLVYALLIYFFMLMSFCVSLSVAIAVESEGWNIFTMMAMMTILNPFIFGIGRIEAIGTNVQTNNIVWSLPAVGILAGELLVIVLALGVTSWIHSRKTAFL
jgi:ABC-2 type transport system permease protein